MTTIALVGSTGLVGSHILKTLITFPPSTLSATSISRKAPSGVPEDRYHAILDSDSSTWPERLSSLRSQVFMSALGTTKAAAGGFENQRKIDLDLNVELAKAAAQSGTKVYVLISSDGSSSGSMIPYSKMKGELEDAVKAIEFEKVVILRPKLLVGERQESRAAEGIFRGLAKSMGSVHPSLMDFWAHDADVVAKAAISAALACVEGKAPSGKVWTISGSEIIKLGRTDWKDQS